MHQVTSHQMPPDALYPIWNCYLPNAACSIFLLLIGMFASAVAGAHITLQLFILQFEQPEAAYRAAYISLTFLSDLNTDRLVLFATMFFASAAIIASLVRLFNLGLLSIAVT